MDREMLIAKLLQKKWWSATRNWLRGEVMQLLHLGYDRFVSDLADFPEMMGEAQVLSLQELVKTENNLICPTFNLQKDGQQFVREFATWKTGADNCAKCILFLYSGKQVTHFVIRRSWQFSLGQEVYDCIGVTRSTLDEELLETLRQEMESRFGEMGEMFTVGLGRIFPDAAMTNCHPNVMAVFAEGTPRQLANVDRGESNSSMVVCPMSEWRRVAENNDDGFFAHIMLRTFAAGFIHLD